MALRDVILRHDQYVTSVVSRYRSQLEPIVATAIARTVSEVQRKLKLGPGGIIEDTPANQRVLRSIDSIFEAEMEKAGYADLSKAFADSFAGQLPFLDDILDTLSAQLRIPLPNVRDVIDAQDRKALAAQQLSVVDNLQSVVDQVAATAKQKVLFGVGGVAVSEVAALLAKGMGKTVAAAETIADTSASMFFRVVTEKAYDVIQKDIPGDVLRFEYEGPDDEITRPFCRSLLESGKAYTKAEIAQMDNKQLPNCMVSCGGWSCRHQWMLSLQLSNAT